MKFIFILLKKYPPNFLDGLLERFDYVLELVYSNPH